MLQWRRAGYDISNRPDILFTLFNVGFSQSHPKPNPRCGGSHIRIDDRLYTFGAVWFDFYYSGELADVFPYSVHRFVADDGQQLSEHEVEQIQRNVSNCSRPERGSEYSRGMEIEVVPEPSTPRRDDPNGWGRVRPAQR